MLTNRNGQIMDGVSVVGGQQPISILPDMTSQVPGQRMSLDGDTEPVHSMEVSFMTKINIIVVV